MDLAQLYKKHDQDKDSFNELRNKTWVDMKQRHELLITAFGSKENLPDYYFKQIDQEIADFSKDWAIPHGSRFKAMDNQQKAQVREITDRVNPANDPGIKKAKGRDQYIQSLPSTRLKQKSAQREKHQEKFISLDQNKASMGLDKAED